MEGIFKRKVQNLIIQLRLAIFNSNCHRKAASKYIMEVFLFTIDTIKYAFRQKKVI